MPQRSNEFQKLVFYITKQLAASNATVTESKMLWDHDTEQDREIDIYIEDRSGPYSVTIGIECTASNRKVDTPKLEQLYHKHRTLRIGQTVIVSKSGFNEKAVRFAQKRGMELLTFNTALEKSWPDWLTALSEVSLAHKKIEVKDLAAQIDYISEQGFNFSDGVTVKIPQVLGTFPIYDFIYECISDNTPVTDKTVDNLREQAWSFNPPLELIDESGTVALCRKMKVSYLESFHRVPLEMQFENFNGQPVVYGVSETGHPYKSMCLTASPSGKKTAYGKPKFNMTIHVNTDEDSDLDFFNIKG